MLALSAVLILFIVCVCVSFVVCLCVFRFSFCTGDVYVLQYCVCVQFIDAYLVQIPRTLSVAWYKCRLPSFMPSCRVLCRVAEFYAE